MLDNSRTIDNDIVTSLKKWKITLLSSMLLSLFLLLLSDKFADTNTTSNRIRHGLLEIWQDQRQRQNNDNKNSDYNAHLQKQQHHHQHQQRRKLNYIRLNTDPKSILLKSQQQLSQSQNNMATRATDEMLSLLTQDEIDELQSLQISKANKLIYVHVPKTGGRTIETSPELFGDMYETLGHYGSGHHPIWKISQIMTKYGSNSIIDSNNGYYISATTIRNPISRFVSAFYWSKYGPPSQSDHKMYPLVQKYMSDVKTVTEFVNKLDKYSYLWDELKSGSSNPILIHFVDQIHWLIHHDSQNTFGIDVVMCHEQWEEGINRLFNTLPSMDGKLFDNSNDLFVRKENVAGSLHEDWTSLPSHIKSSILNHYEIDTCMFGYDQNVYPLFDLNSNVINADSTQCIGSIVKTKDEFTKRYQWCIDRINENNGNNNKIRTKASNR